jgi:elongator complex protein 1
MKSIWVCIAFFLWVILDCNFIWYFVVQLWTTGNYHWYLKQEISASAFAAKRFTSVEWHPEATLRLILTTPSKLTVPSVCSFNFFHSIINHDSVISANVVQRTYTYETTTSLISPPNDSGMVAVIDGLNVLLTPFRTQNVPPPMSGYQFKIPSPSSSPSSESAGWFAPTTLPIHISLSHTTTKPDTLALLWENGYVECWEFNTRLGPGKGKVMNPTKIWDFCIPPQSESRVRWRQVSFSGSRAGVVDVLGSGDDGKDVIVSLMWDVANQNKDVPVTVNRRKVLSGGRRNGKMVAGFGGEDSEALWQGPDGGIFRGKTNKSFCNSGEATNIKFTAVDGEDPSSSPNPIAQFPQICITTWACPLVLSATSPPITLCFGLTEGGKLYATSLSSSSSSSTTNAQISTGVTSFAVASGFLIYTTTSHEAVFGPLESVGVILGISAENEGGFQGSALGGDGDGDDNDSVDLTFPPPPPPPANKASTPAPSNPATIVEGWERRRVERGSRIVTVVPSSMALVLQMPRGNLETIYPRPLVMSVVRGDLDAYVVFLSFSPPLFML